MALSCPECDEPMRLASTKCAGAVMQDSLWFRACCYIPMDSVVIKTLTELRTACQARLREKVVHQTEAAGYVFVAPQGGFMMNLNCTWHWLLKRSGLEGLRFHDLHRIIGSRLAMAGVPIFTIGKLMGHKTMRMTERYAHLSRDHLHEAVEVRASPGQKPWTHNIVNDGGRIGGPIAEHLEPSLDMAEGRHGFRAIGTIQRARSSWTAGTLMSCRCF